MSAAEWGLTSLLHLLSTLFLHACAFPYVSSSSFVQVADAKQLGEWVGLCKLDKDAKPRKVVACSCVVVKDYGEESNALTVLLEYFKKRGSQ